MLLGPNDPRAITGAELEAARQNTQQWEAFFGLVPMTQTEIEDKARTLDAILTLIGYNDEVETP